MFESCISRISAEAARQINEDLLNSKPGSEYANTTAVSSTNSTNTITGLHKHRHNPEGVFCMTPGCNKGDHDHAHCYGKGGGMEGQAPWQKKKREGVVTAAAAVTPPPPVSIPAPRAPMVMTAVAAATNTSSYYPDHDLQSVKVRTANHGHLETSGRVGWMVKQGWEISFRGDPGHSPYGTISPYWTKSCLPSTGRCGPSHKVAEFAHSTHRNIPSVHVLSVSVSSYCWLLLDPVEFTRKTVLSRPAYTWYLTHFTCLPVLIPGTFPVSHTWYSLDFASTYSASPRILVPLRILPQAAVPSSAHHFPTHCSPRSYLRNCSQSYPLGSTTILAPSRISTLSL
ncbi:hypothetical protein DEU56DRAFT_751978 [Suillus clintonianus]|uniref:uncharacterized protein n=1 Tax=Suillus clintonianus TaxID=1904413 RepID=UPI001B8669B6|nr:uncharacterized protein DEU56DRAFT_751978 [Suillus clintonianus]KAG2153397.1 hypothetical protein DEU56DRAFT_751978 [Suillus clintonianus]